MKPTLVIGGYQRSAKLVLYTSCCRIILNLVLAFVEATSNGVVVDFGPSSATGISIHSVQGECWPLKRVDWFCSLCPCLKYLFIVGTRVLVRLDVVLSTTASDCNFIRAVCIVQGQLIEL